MNKIIINANKSYGEKSHRSLNNDQTMNNSKKIFKEREYSCGYAKL